MIIIQLIGGLGNQMFQYALGRALNIKLNVEFKLDLSEFETYKLRSYDLQVYNINEKIASSEEINRTKYAHKLTDRIKSFIYNKKKFSNNYIIENNKNFDETIFNIKDNCYIAGYWQNEKYFKNIRQIILKDFSPKKKLAGKNLEIAQLIQQTNSVSLHVRRGDYVSNATTNAYHGVCSVEYYYQAINIIKSKIRHPVFYIFSDDFSWVKNNLSLKEKYMYVDFNNSNNSYEDIRLMSLCKNSILANSSFSWWGAWLNQNQHKTVVAPQKWFNTNIATEIIPDDWHKI